MPISVSGSPRVLVIEDEPDLQEALVAYMRMEGMQAHGVSSLHEAEGWMAKNDCDILLLDLGLPDGDGIIWLNKNDNVKEKGIIIVTARSDALSRVNGVRAGADVYLVKPVLPEEIVSLVNNMMRRLRGQAPANWVLDSTGWRLFLPDGRNLKLTHSEHMLLQRLASVAGQAVSRENLASSMGNNPEYYDFRRMEVLVRRLRNKFSDTLGVNIPLETVHRQGYAFTANIVIANA